MHIQSFAAKAHQRGVSTLVVAIVLLIAATFLTFFAAKVGIQEQRMSANEYRHKEAFATAEAGLDRAKAFLAANRQGFSGWGWTACAGTETTPPCGDGTANQFGSAWSWVNVYTLSGGDALSGLTWDSADGPFILTQNDGTPITATTSFQPVTLVAQASSADGTGRAVVRQSMSRYLIAQPGPVPPLMAPTVPLGATSPWSATPTTTSTSRRSIYPTVMTSPAAGRCCPSGPRIRSLRAAHGKPVDLALSGTGLRRPTPAVSAPIS
ncbi:pilus assembly PilX family protein [Immundisolibacter cernigliae]|uniref:Type 4 fimbrial biogenesis protein PilX N-terminal domain-containing protein n=1 Tax=Immundisolibacter cernigliae TaxID=1810504 RepID=A0A1B1YQH3_9GAMM|nr:PilX N-terminal domain-containing pilus assembly protein [Immundisolibacter cernigliae]ANX03028.1 hypothetical protein PG2T_01685 [Immundisolibacter cernigliae]